MNQILRYDWLPERARWSCLARSGLTAVSRKKNFPESHIINSLLTKLVRPRWLDIGQVLFLRVYGPRRSRGPQTRKKRTWPIFSHLGRTSLVNNPYVLSTVAYQNLHILNFCWKSNHGMLDHAPFFKAWIIIKHWRRHYCSAINKARAWKMNEHLILRHHLKLGFIAWNVFEN